MLADFRKCPLLYHRKRQGLVAESQERPAYLIAQQENEAAIGRLRRCLETGHWPTGYEEPRLFDAA